MPSPDHSDFALAAPRQTVDFLTRQEVISVASLKLAVYKSLLQAHIACFLNRRIDCFLREVQKYEDLLLQIKSEFYSIKFAYLIV